MKLSYLHDKIGGVLQNDAEFVSVTADSNDVTKECLFVCLVGNHVDTHALAAQVVAQGAVALVVQRYLPLDVAQLLVSDTRKALSQAAALLYGFPKKDMQLVGVTGTNGKTTTAYLLQRAFAASGREAAYIGTLGIVCKEYLAPPTLTTPDPVRLFSTLADLYARGVRYVFVEVSAHAIYWHKIDGVRFNAVVFTNISQDHLDFFGTMQSYAQTKLSMFTYAHTALGVVNVDDKYGRKILQDYQIPLVTYGLHNPCDVFAVHIRDAYDGLNFVVNAYDMVYAVQTNLHGEFNVYNILAVATVCGYYGVEPRDLQSALYNVTVPGRFNVVERRGVRYVIDYAHTPDGLQKALQACRKLTAGKLMVVFGCGGDRDKDKRAQMGAIATRLADYVIVTTDNPRTEEPMAIAQNIEAGMVADGKYEIVLDRAQAIQRAHTLCVDGDCVLIAGKGNEPYIETASGRVPYSDLAVVEKLS